MGSADCELAFYGQIAEGYLLQEVKENVAELFKAGPDQVERMFTGRRVVIRNKLDIETAEKYVVALRKRGAICQIERMGAPGELVKKPAVPAEEKASAAEASSSETVHSAAQAPENSAYQTTEVRRAEPGRPEAMPLAGEKVDEILAGSHFNLDPVGVNLSEPTETSPPSFPEIEQLTIAPVGSDIGERKAPVPTPEPDISHLTLAPLPSEEK